MMNSTNRLETIATRQRASRLRDLVFMVCVALAAVVSVTTLSTACDAATVSQR